MGMERCRYIGNADVSGTPFKKALKRPHTLPKYVASCCVLNSPEKITKIVPKVIKIYQNINTNKYKIPCLTHTHNNIRPVCDATHTHTHTQTHTPASVVGFYV